MRRRDFVAVFAASAVLAPRGGAAQQAPSLRRLGILEAAPNAAVAAQLGQTPAFLDELRRLGWREGENIAIDRRFGGGVPVRFTSEARELVALRPEVILASTAPALKALLAATRTVPLVFTLVADPVAFGVVQSLAHPGGNVTGFSPLEPQVAGKFVEILKEIAPNTTRILFIFEPLKGQQLMRDAAAVAARSLGVAFAAASIGNFADIEREIGALAHEPGGGLILTASATAFPQRERLNALLLQHRLPAVFSFPNFARAGGLAAYSSDRVAQFRQAAGDVDRILRGEKPADLPVQLPTKFQLIINLKTAKALGLTVPQSLLARADEVIE